LRIVTDFRTKGCQGTCALLYANRALQCGRAAANESSKPLRANRLSDAPRSAAECASEPGLRGASRRMKTFPCTHCPGSANRIRRHECRRQQLAVFHKVQGAEIACAAAGEPGSWARTHPVRSAVRGSIGTMFLVLTCRASLELAGFHAGGGPKFRRLQPDQDWCYTRSSTGVAVIRPRQNRCVEHARTTFCKGAGAPPAGRLHACLPVPVRRIAACAEGKASPLLCCRRNAISNAALRHIGYLPKKENDQGEAEPPNALARGDDVWHRVLPFSPIGSYASAVFGALQRKAGSRTLKASSLRLLSDRCPRHVACPSVEKKNTKSETRNSKA